MKNKRRLISVMIILCMLIGCRAFSVFASSESYIRITATQDHSDAQKVLKLINKQRSRRGLKTLKLDKELSKSAAKRAAELMVYIPETGPHRRPNGKLTRTINSRIIYECCAEGYATPEDTVKGWMSSPPHRKGILLRKAKSVGIGCVTSINGVKYWTLEFSEDKAKKVENRRSRITSSYKVTALPKHLRKGSFYLALKDERAGMLDTWTETGLGEKVRIHPVFRNNLYFDTQLRPSDFIWKSGNKAVAEVDPRGRVKTKKAGKAVITATMKNAPGYKLRLRLRVVRSPEHFD